jgi:hypothetical protein
MLPRRKDGNAPGSALREKAEDAGSVALTATGHNEPIGAPSSGGKTEELVHQSGDRAVMKVPFRSKGRGDV